VQSSVASSNAASPMSLSQPLTLHRTTPSTAATNEPPKVNHHISVDELF